MLFIAHSFLCLNSAWAFFLSRVAFVLPEVDYCTSLCMCGSNGCYECVEILTLVTLNTMASGELCSSIWSPPPPFHLQHLKCTLSLPFQAAAITSVVRDSATGLIKIQSRWKRFLCCSECWANVAPFLFLSPSWHFGSQMYIDLHAATKALNSRRSAVILLCAFVLRCHVQVD